MLEKGGSHPTSAARPRTDSPDPSPHAPCPHPPPRTHSPAGHDAAHFALSSDWRVNLAATYAAPWFSSPLMWAHQHTIGHHVYTNVPGRDPDLYHAPAYWRFTHSLRWRPAHAWQAVVTLPMWLFAVPTLLLIKPLLALHMGLYNRAVVLMRLPAWRAALHVVGRAAVAFSVYGWPWLVFRGDPAKAAAFAVVPLSVYSMFFMAASQVNHHDEALSHAHSPQWYRHQVRRRWGERWGGGAGCPQPPPVAHRPPSHPPACLPHTTPTTHPPPPPTHHPPPTRLRRRTPSRPTAGSPSSCRGASTCRSSTTCCPASTTSTCGRCRCVHAARGGPGAGAGPPPRALCVSGALPTTHPAAPSRPPPMQPEIEAAARRHGVPYLRSRSIPEAFGRLWAHLRVMGRQPSPMDAARAKAE